MAKVIPADSQFVKRNTQFFRYRNYHELSIASARFVLTLAGDCIKKFGRFIFCISGGKTPLGIYTLLGRTKLRQRINWNFVFVFWVDERFVPREHPENNYRLAYRYFLSHVAIPDKNIFRIPTEYSTPEECALEYEKTLRGFFKFRDKDSGFPVFDLVLLGLGKDGHIGSLYSGDKTLLEKQNWVASVEAPPYYTVRKRITLTFPVINNSRNVIFLVSGEDKKEILRTAMEGQPLNNPIPAQFVKPKGDLYWFTDIRI